jgi:REP element-mobilizing transposase RayT
VVFDTNLIIQHIRKGEFLPSTAILPVVVGGELRAFAFKADSGTQKLAFLESLLKRYPIVEVTVYLTEKYALIGRKAYLVWMSETIIKIHNQRILLYHFVCRVKYRRKVFTCEVKATLKAVCAGISEGYEVYFIEIGTDAAHVHFLIQSLPMLSAKQIIQMVKSISAHQIFGSHPQVKKMLWGGTFWTSGYYVNTVGVYADENTIRKYVHNQGRD